MPAYHRQSDSTTSTTCAFCGLSLGLQDLSEHIQKHSNSELGEKWMQLSDDEQTFYGPILSPDQMWHIQGVVLDSQEVQR